MKTATSNLQRHHSSPTGVGVGVGSNDGETGTNNDDIAADPTTARRSSSHRIMLSPFQSLRRRISRSKSHDSTDHPSLPIEPPAVSTGTEAGRSVSNSHVVSSGPSPTVSDEVLQQFHNEAHTKVKESLKVPEPVSSSGTEGDTSHTMLDQAANRLETLPKFLSDEIVTSDGGNVIQKFVLKSHNFNDSDNEGRELLSRTCRLRRDGEEEEAKQETENDMNQSSTKDGPLRYSLKRVTSLSNDDMALNKKLLENMYNDIYMLSVIGEEHPHIIKLHGFMMVNNLDDKSNYYYGYIVDTIDETLEETLKGPKGRWFLKHKELHQHHFLGSIFRRNSSETSHEEKRRIFYQERLGYCVDLASAVKYMHSQCGVIHECIQPCNIGFDIEGNIKLMNFEQACVVVDKGDGSASTQIKDTGTASFTSSEMSCEELKYLAPELYNFKNSSHPSMDIYSFSYILWEMIGLHPLFSDFSKDQIVTVVYEKGCRPIFDKQQHCWSLRVIELLKKMWSEDPLERPTSQQVYDILWKELYSHHVVQAK